MPPFVDFVQTQREHRPIRYVICNFFHWTLSEFYFLFGEQAEDWIIDRDFKLFTGFLREVWRDTSEDVTVCSG